MRNGSTSKSKQKKNEETVTFESGSGNVFADIGLPHPEVFFIKAQLVSTIEEMMKKRNFSLKRAAEFFKLDPKQYENLISGQTQRFSIDRLLKMLNKLGHTIEIRVHPIENRLPNSTFKS